MLTDMASLEGKKVKLQFSELQAFDDGEKMVNIDIEETIFRGFKLCVESTKTIKDIKSLLALVNSEYTAEEHTLWFNGIVLEDYNNVKFYTDQSSVKFKLLVERHMLIHVVTEFDQAMQFNVKPSTTIAKFKTVLEQNLHIPAVVQKLTHNQKQINNNSKSLYDYNLHSGAWIMVKADCRPISINVRTQSGEVYAFEAKKYCPAYYVKQLLANKIGCYTPCQLRLIFNSVVLENEVTLVHYNMTDGAILDAILHLTGC